MFSKDNKVLLKEFVKTDFKLRYQQSVIGYLWSILYPLMYFTILYVVFAKFLRLGAGMPHWAVAMLFGTVVWTFFDEATHRCLSTVVGHGGLLRKVDFNKSILIAAELSGAAINFGINLVVILIFMIINGVQIHWTIIFIVPFILELVLVTAGISFILATMYVNFRDIEPIWNVLLQLGMFGSAIIYPFSYIYSMSPNIAKGILMNPLAQIIADMRWALLDPAGIVYPGTWQFISTPYFLIIPYALSIIIFIVGYFIYNKKAQDFAEVI